MFGVENLTLKYVLYFIWGTGWILKQFIKYFFEY